MNYLARLYRGHYPPALLLLLVIGIGLSSAFTLPMSNHEAYVVQTAQEMHDRGAWIVPYLNGEPRLTKPPLAYWLTAATAWLFSADPVRVLPWHGRLPSVLAGALLLLLIYALGSAWGDAQLAELAAWLGLSSLGLVSYISSARAELLYALFCTLSLYGFVRALQAAPGSRRQAGWAMLIWLGFALAILNKGPHVPGFFLFTFLLILWFGGHSGKHWLQVLRPWSGLLIVTLISVPWWLAVRAAIAATQSLQSTQLSGSLLVPHLPSAYYLLQSFHMVLPWLLLVPGAAWVSLHPRNTWLPAWQLGLFVLLPALLFSFGIQQRWFYMLPSLAPLLVLMAAAVMQQQRNGIGLWLPRVLVRHFHALHWLLFSLLMLGLLLRSSAGDAGIIAPLLGLSVCLLLGAGYYLLVPVAARDVQVALRAAALLFAAIVLTLNLAGFTWSESTWQRDRFAQQVAARVPAGAALFILDGEPALYTYYTRRRVPQLADWQQLMSIAPVQAADWYLVLRDRQMPDMPPELQARQLLGNGEFSLLRFGPAAGAPNR